MISFRAQPPQSDDYDSLTFQGENESLLAHLVGEMLQGAGWSVLSAHNGDDYEELDWNA